MPVETGLIHRKPGFLFLFVGIENIRFGAPLPLQLLPHDNIFPGMVMPAPLSSSRCSTKVPRSKAKSFDAATSMCVGAKCRAKPGLAIVKRQGRSGFGIEAGKLVGILVLRGAQPLRVQIANDLLVTFGRSTACPVDFDSLLAGSRTIQTRDARGNGVVEVSRLDFAGRHCPVVAAECWHGRWVRAHSLLSWR
jgi:hypothetical protein